jgi:hypothetical protein
LELGSSFWQGLGAVLFGTGQGYLGKSLPWRGFWLLIACPHSEKPVLARADVGASLEYAAGPAVIIRAGLIISGEVRMSLAIGSGSLSGVSGGQPSRAALAAEVAHYQKQLSDCVNCPSSKTLEGKAHIRELSTQISVDQQRIKQIEANGPAANDADASTHADTYTSAGASATSPAQVRGSLVNVFA